MCIFLNVFYASNVIVWDSSWKIVYKMCHNVHNRSCVYSHRKKKLDTFRGIFFSNKSAQYPSLFMFSSLAAMWQAIQMWIKLEKYRFDGFCAFFNFLFLFSVLVFEIYKSKRSYVMSRTTDLKMTLMNGLVFGGTFYFSHFHYV